LRRCKWSRSNPCTAMNRIPVESANIKSIGHDPALNVMEVEFQNGSLYAYANVGPESYRKIMSHSSIGSAFYYHVRANPTRHPFVQIK